MRTNWCFRLGLAFFAPGVFLFSIYIYIYHAADSGKETSSSDMPMLPCFADTEVITGNQDLEADNEETITYYNDSDSSVSGQCG